MKTPSLDRDFNEVQVETPNQGNETLTNVNTVVQESLGGDETRPRLVEHSQISNEIQAWTESSEQKNNDRTTKMIEEMENKYEAIFEKIRTKKVHQQ